MNRGQTRVSKKIGFTIVELIVVIVVIGILASITVVGYSYVRRDAVESRMKANIGQVKSYLVAYRALNGGLYPPSVGDRATDVPDVEAFMNDPDTPVVPYRTSPNRRKFCIEVQSKQYPNMKFIAIDNAGNGVPAVNEGGSCPGSLSD